MILQVWCLMRMRGNALFILILTTKDYVTASTVIFNLKSAVEAEGKARCS